jgi:ketosteroid isomerase-like protein
VSRANVEIVKRGVEAFNRRDVDLLAELTTQDFEWFPALPGAVEADGYRGREGMETYLAQISATWEELRILIDEARDLGDGVLVLGRTEGRGRASGVQVDSPIGIAYDLRRGRVSRVRAYLDHHDALKAVGLEE